ncbi:hypothetical protein SEA_LESNORAH_47 [Microbacterium phage LesNorah]|nr:hypothetical protein SEA_LESNORAH_47 [Microbacterium phage LesNorah]
MVASIRSTAIGKNNGSNTAPLPLPAGIVAGDLLIELYLAGSASANTTDSVAKGWWRYAAQAFNTRSFAIYARIYNPADAASVYTLTQAASANSKYIAFAIKDHGVTAEGDLQIGTAWLRGDNGGSQGPITAPSITTPGADRLVLALLGEASNTVGGYTVSQASGFTNVVDAPEGGTAGVDIEYLTSFQKVQSAAGATGTFILTFGAAVSLNGLGIQMSIPPAAAPLPTIGARLATNPTDTSVTVGVDVANGTHVQAYLYQGATLVTLREFDVDATSGWGHATFTNLTPDTGYTVQFVVDGNELVSQALSVRTLPEATGAASFVMVTGSCQFTGSNHPVFDAILADQPRVFAHMGDLHYADATTAAAWRAGVETSLAAPRMKNLLGQIPMTWTWDNHDRIITNGGGAGTALNLGTTDPATNTEARKLFGSDGMGTADSFGRAWWMGRVLFIQTDQWTNKDDPDDGVDEYKSFLGTAQREWFMDTLELLGGGAAAIVWLCQWTGQNHANGRWNSFPGETDALEQFFNVNLWLKEKLVMIGGDSHSLQVTDGTRTAAQGQRFEGVPNFNISGFNRSSDAGQGGAGWLVDQPLRTSAQPEADWGGYSRITVEDDGLVLTMTWEGVRVNSAGATDVMDTRTLTFGELPPEPTQPFDKVYVGSGLADKVYVGDTQVWP